jgi:hypothetical protein
MTIVLLKLGHAETHEQKQFGHQMIGDPVRSLQHYCMSRLTLSIRASVKSQAG